MEWVRRYGPVLLAIAALLATVALHYTRSVAQHGGLFVYALDDAYIHMAMAKNVPRRRRMG